MRCLIIGASTGLGRALAERLASDGHDLFLVASDERDLAALASHLALGEGITAAFAALDLADFDADALRDQVRAAMGEIDALFFIAGVGSDDDHGQIPDALARRLIDVNFSGGVRIVNAFLDELAGRPKAACVGIGSVASVRGRGVNMIYGAAKRGLEFYFEALRHRMRATGCRVQFYRVGYMATAMLGDRGKTLLPAAEPDSIARRVVANLERDVGMCYLPRWWRLIALALRMLPWAAFKRLSV